MSLCRFVFWLTMRFIRAHGWWGQWFSTVETLRRTEPIPCLRDHDWRCIWLTFIGEKLLLSYYAFQFICIKLGEVFEMWIFRQSGTLNLPLYRVSTTLLFLQVGTDQHDDLATAPWCCSNVFHIPIWSLETVWERRHDDLAENSVSEVY